MSSLSSRRESSGRGCDEKAEAKIRISQPICAKCGGYFELKPGQPEGAFFEWKCQCSARVLHYPQDYVVFDKLTGAAEMSVYFNGFVRMVVVEGFRGRSEVDGLATAESIRKYVADNGLTDMKEELIMKLKALHLARKL